jgi:DNA-binding MarR family transcriptional regulator
MLRDNSLIPIEAVRLCALGRLMQGDLRYAALAGEVRYFTSRLVGPSLDLLGTSIELLRLEGLVEAVGGRGMEDDALLRITPAGREAFRALMRARVRAPGGDVGRLVLALKLRFLDLLSAEDRAEQVELMADAHRQERARLADLRRHAANGHLAQWLDLEIAQIDQRLAWIEGVGAKA